MKTAIVKLRSAAPYQPSRKHESPHNEKEGHDAYEQRTWAEKLHYDDKGQVYIPPMAFKMALDKASSLLRIQIPGKGKSEYTKHFKCGVLVTDPVYLGVKKEDVPGERWHCNSDGVRGSGKRVWRWFPVIREWAATLSYIILDETITPDIFERVLAESGKFVGIGRFRPENGGFYGRYEVVSVKWS